MTDNKKCKAYIEINYGVGYAPCYNLAIKCDFCEKHQDWVNNDYRLEIVENYYCISKMKDIILKNKTNSRITTINTLLNFLVHHKTFLRKNTIISNAIYQKLLEAKEDDEIKNLVDLDTFQKELFPYSMINDDNIDSYDLMVEI